MSNLGNCDNNTPPKPCGPRPVVKQQKYINYRLRPQLDEPGPKKSRLYSVLHAFTPGSVKRLDAARANRLAHDARGRAHVDRIREGETEATSAPPDPFSAAPVVPPNYDRAGETTLRPDPRPVVKQQKYINYRLRPQLDEPGAKKSRLYSNLHAFTPGSVKRLDAARIAEIARDARANRLVHDARGRAHVDRIRDGETEATSAPPDPAAPVVPPNYDGAGETTSPPDPVVVIHRFNQIRDHAQNRLKYRRELFPTTQEIFQKKKQT